MKMSNIHLNRYFLLKYHYSNNEKKTNYEIVLVLAPLLLIKLT